MRIALLGLGRIGLVHASNLWSLPDVDLVICEPDAPRRERAAAFGSITASLDEALEGVDGVVVATPTALHTEQLLISAEARCPVFSEKPISLDLATTVAVLEHLDEVGVPLQVGFQRRFDPGFIEMHRLISAGELGEIFLVRTACHDHVPPPEEYLATSGSIFKDMHTHDFDAIPWLTGRRIETVFARGSVLVDDRFSRNNDVDTCALTLTLEGGALAVITGARADGVGYDHRTEVFGSRDSLSAGFDPRTPLRSTDPGGYSPADPYDGFPERFSSAYRAEMIAFCDLVAGRGPNRAPGAAALEALRVAVAADRSLATGMPVAVEEIDDLPQP